MRISRSSDYRTSVAFRKRRRILVAALVLIGGIAGAVMVVSAADNVQVSNVTASPDAPVTGETVTIDATIANLPSSNETVELTDVYVRTSGTVDEHARIEDIGAIEPGGTLTVPVVATFDSPGEKRLTVRAVTRDESGEYDSYEYPLYVTVEEPRVRADISTSTAANSTGKTTVELTNYGNTDLANVQITATTGGEVLDRKHTFDVEPESSESVRFDTSNVSGADVTFNASYEAAGAHHSTEQDRSIGETSGVPGEIHLTRVSAVPGPGGTTIEGEAANLGGTDVGSVMLRVHDPDGNGSTTSAGEYFVGPVEASEFATFELSADLPDGQETVPVEIGYNVDGERKTKVQRIQAESGQSMTPPGGPDQGAGQPGGPGDFGDGPDGAPAGPGAPGNSGGLPLVPIAIVGVLLVGGFLTYRWRNQ